MGMSKRERFFFVAAPLAVLVGGMGLWYIMYDGLTKAVEVQIASGEHEYSKTYVGQNSSTQATTSEGQLVIMPMEITHHVRWMNDEEGKLVGGYPSSTFPKGYADITFGLNSKVAAENNLVVGSHVQEFVELGFREDGVVVWREVKRQYPASSSNRQGGK